MAIINGDRITYDYSHLIARLKADLEDELISTDTIIDIVRDEERNCLNIVHSYRPIVNYHLPNDYLLYEHVLWELLTGGGECTEEERPEMIRAAKYAIAKFREESKRFEKCTALAALTEMEQLTR